MSVLVKIALGGMALGFVALYLIAGAGSVLGFWVDKAECDGYMLQEAKKGILAECPKKQLKR